MRHVSATIDGRNASAARVLERAGMRREGRKTVWFKGEQVEECWYGMDRVSYSGPR
jgi:RimJ/RimL family protein N-acetyltransferase